MSENSKMHKTVGDKISRKLTFKEILIVEWRYAENKLG
jgi:hypothetical protein